MAATKDVIGRLEARSIQGQPNFLDPLVRLTRDCLPCRIFTGERTGDGYGRLRVKGIKVLTHRVAYEMFVGPISAGDKLDHLCRNASCWEPTHLEPVTHAENISRGRSGLFALMCSRGHWFDEANTYWHNGHQGCRICRAEAHKRYILRKESA